MFFYQDKLPSAGTIVVVNMIEDSGGETENCFYVTIPEYNNFRGIIHKRELPKKIHHQRKKITEMKQAKHIVCVVTVTPSFESDGQPELIELSIKSADPKHHPHIFTRQKNIEKLLKIVKFVSMHFKYNFEDLVELLHDDEIVPLTQIDNIDGVDDYTELYNNHLRKYPELLRMMNIDEEDERFAEISEQINSLIKRTESTATLDFDIFVWKSVQNYDAIFVLRDVFDHVLKVHADQKIELRYLGAPSYQLTFQQMDESVIDTALESIKNTFINFMAERHIICFDLKFDPSNKKIKSGDVSISFPYKIDID